MVKTRILTDGEPLENIISGAEKLYKAVSTTMGPRGSNVIVRKAGARTLVTHDGVTVAKSVKIDDPAEDIAADLLREAAMKLDATTGDGTTTVTVLSYHLLKNLAKMVQDGANPMKLKLAIEELEPSIIKAIKRASKPVTTEKQLVAVATVAAGNQEIGKEVGKVVFQAGKDTPVILAFTDSTETVTEVIHGVRLEAGSASSYLLDEGMKTTIESPRVVVCDAKLRDKEDVLPILKSISQLPAGERNFILVAGDVAGDALALLVMNRLKGFANIGVVRVPQTIVNHADYLSDIALSTGATVLSRNTAHSIRDAELSQFGAAQKAVVQLAETLIINGDHSEEDVLARQAGLNETIRTSTEKAVRDFAEQRYKFLNQKIVSIHVGGQSETEAEERHYRYEDALGAARSALRHGFVPGGGTLLFEIGEHYLPDTPVGIAMGWALQAPLNKVYENAGIGEFEEAIEAGRGIDVLHPENGVIDLVKAGIVDPTESELESVKTAITIAGLLLTSGAMIVDEVTEEKSNVPTF